MMNRSRHNPKLKKAAAGYNDFLGDFSKKASGVPMQFGQTGRSGESDTIIPGLDRLYITLGYATTEKGSEYLVYKEN
jgi:hypothetical protein